MPSRTTRSVRPTSSRRSSLAGDVRIDPCAPRAPAALRARRATDADYWDLARSAPDEVVRHDAALVAECERIGRDHREIVRMHEGVIEAGDPAGDLARRVNRLRPLGVSFFLVNSWPKSDPGLVDDVGAGLAAIRRRHP